MDSPQDFFKDFSRRSPLFFFLRTRDSPKDSFKDSSMSTSWDSLKDIFRNPTGMLFKIPPRITYFVPPEIFLDSHKNLSWILRIFLHELFQGFFPLNFFRVSSWIFMFFLFSFSAKVTPAVLSGICLTLSESRFFQRSLQIPWGIFPSCFFLWIYPGITPGISSAILPDCCSIFFWESLVMFLFK